MISVFRKELRKWTSVLWVVFASMILASLSILVLRRPSAREITIASVDSKPIFLTEYQQAVAQLKLQLEMLASYARAQGLSPEMFLAMTGLNKPEEAALKELINQKLLESVANALYLTLDPVDFRDQLGRSLPQQLFDPAGNLNEQSYKEYLTRLGLTIGEYEAKKEQETKQHFIEKLIKSAAYYMPPYALEDYQDRVTSKKSFKILELPLATFLEKSKTEKPTEEQLRDFYEKNKENYRVPEKRKAIYWTLSRDEYLKKVAIDDEAIETFYEKNKSSLFRIPAEVKLRKLVVGVENASSPASVMKAQLKAQELHKEVLTHPESFEKVVLKSSTDKEAAKTGGLTAFFKRGTFNDTLEKEAFKLKEIGDISPIIRFDDRFEIVRLADRKQASYKPLSLVRNEIIKTLKERKAIHLMQSDVEAVIHGAREDKAVFETFIQKEGLKPITSAWLTREDERGYTEHSMLAQKLFNKKKNKGYASSFKYKNSIILFQEKGRENSFVPPLSALHEKIENALIDENAALAQKAAVADIARNFLEKKGTLEELAKRYNGRIITTELLKDGGAVTELKDSSSLVRKAFQLTDRHQILKHKHKTNCFLVCLDKVEKTSKEIADKDKKLFIDREMEQKKMLNFNAFIASLLRRATIEKYEKIGTYEAQNYSPEDIL